MKYNTVGKRKNKRRSQRYRKTRRRRRKNRRRRTKFQKGSNKTHRRRRKQRKGGELSNCQPIRAQQAAIRQVFNQISIDQMGGINTDAALNAFHRIGEGANITPQSLGQMMARDGSYFSSTGDLVVDFDTFSKIIEGRCRTHRRHTWHMLFRKIAAIIPEVKQDSDGEFVFAAVAPPLFPLHSWGAASRAARGAAQLTLVPPPPRRSS